MSVDRARSTLFQPRKPRCPMCDNSGFKVVGHPYGEPVLRCHACGHEWESKHGRSDARGTDRRPQQ